MYAGTEQYRHRGELVVADEVAGDLVGIFRDLYQGSYPLRAMYLGRPLRLQPSTPGCPPPARVPLAGASDWQHFQD